jgi:serine/threonine protein kinase
VPWHHRGLAYLHHGVNPNNIHRDIKTSNRLLNTNLTYKISFFGVPKCLPPNTTHVSTNTTHVSTIVTGTM